jgi:hypothetical protein
MDGEEHTANGALCALVSRGQALLCELLRLSDRVPAPFRPENAAKHAAVLFDFAYLKARAREGASSSVQRGAARHAARTEPLGLLGRASHARSGSAAGATLRRAAATRALCIRVALRARRSSRPPGYATPARSERLVRAAALFPFSAQSSEAFDARVESSAELSDAWDALRESCAPLVARFYQARTPLCTACEMPGRSPNTTPGALSRLLSSTAAVCGHHALPRRRVALLGRP